MVFPYVILAPVISSKIIIYVTIFIIFIFLILRCTIVQFYNTIFYILVFFIKVSSICAILTYIDFNHFGALDCRLRYRNHWEIFLKIRKLATHLSILTTPEMQDKTYQDSISAPLNALCNSLYVYYSVYGCRYVYKSILKTLFTFSI